jgi:hypothetical protein
MKKLSNVCCCIYLLKSELFIQSIREDTWIPFMQRSGRVLKFPTVQPEHKSISLTRQNCYHLPILVQLLTDIFPPKRTTKILSLGDTGLIISSPNEINPWSICLIIELIQKFQQQSLIMLLKINNSISSFTLGFA